MEVEAKHDVENFDHKKGNKNHKKHTDNEHKKAIDHELKKSIEHEHKKPSDHLSKYSGSRKSSLETTVMKHQMNFQRVENTFKLSPDDNKRFFAFKLQPHILDILKDMTLKAENDSKGHHHLTRELAERIRNEAKTYGYPRYKIVVFVAAGDNVGQDVRVASRCLWNTEFDNCVSASHNTKTLWTSAVVYVFYSD